MANRTWLNADSCQQQQNSMAVTSVPQSMQISSTLDTHCTSITTQHTCTLESSKSLISQWHCNVSATGVQAVLIRTDMTMAVNKQRLRPLRLTSRGRNLLQNPHMDCRVLHATFPPPPHPTPINSLHPPDSCRPQNSGRPPVHVIPVPPPAKNRQQSSSTPHG